jgi:ATP-binding cassette subfamily B protein
LVLAWKYRYGCLKALLLQLGLLALALSNLGLAGVAVDFLRHCLDPAVPPPHWPFGLAPPPDWGPMRVMAALGAAILLFSLLRCLLQYGYAMTVAWLSGREIVPTLRTEVYAKLQRLSFRFFDAHPGSSIINRVTGDVQLLRAFIDEVLINGTVLSITLTVYVAYMLRLHPGLTLACLATAPVITGVAVAFSHGIKDAHRRNRALVDHLILALTETIEGIHTIKGFGREPAAERRYAAANAEVQGQQLGIFHATSRFMGFMDFMTHFNFFILLGYGGWLVLQGELALGTGLVVFAGLLQQFSNQLGQIANLTNVIQQSLVGARRVFEILDAPVEIRSKPSAVPAGRLQGALRFEQVSLEHARNQPVLHDIEFDIQPGQYVAIMGATGSGKSALMSLIPRFYDPTRGHVLVDGRDVRDLELSSLRRNIGLVFQESFLFNATVAENIAFGHPEATREEIERAAAIACAHEFIRALPKGYDTLVSERGTNLSGGQRQRIAIARAILVNPGILLLDDPTASLDPETDEEIYRAMSRAIEGRTTLVVAHRLATVQRADQILVLDRGRIVQRGTHAQLVRQQGIYLKVARLQLVDSDTLLAEAAREEA